jgi:UDP-N-acetylmuramoyl-tripeptide--D-alanyl-D-alanine ligase
MIEMSLTEIAQILGCQSPKQDSAIHGVSRDTRHISPGNLYIAIQGERFDGHNFINEAAKQGATAALVSRKVDAAIPQIIVPDTLAALGRLSAHWRQRFNIPFIGVTGSNGKTTLKNMIAAILTAACDNHAEQVLATEGNLNNNIGVPLMLLRLNSNHRYSVIEMGMNAFNEIAYLTKLTHPAVAVINNAAASHLAGVKNIAGVAQAKGEIFQGLSADGIAILNRDDDYFEYWRKLIGTHQYLSFGLNNPADIYADIGGNNQITIHTPRGKFTLTLPLLGLHNVMNALAATAATLAIDIDLTAIKQGLESVAPAPGRMHQFSLKNGAKIIDDTYNANPFSLHAAAQTLATLPGTTIVVLGDMKELGDDAEKMHFEAGVKMKKLGIHHLFTYGNLSAETQRGFGGETTQHFTDREQLYTALQPYLKPDVTALIKGSRSMQMEKIIQLIAPEKKLEHTH